MSQSMPPSLSDFLRAVPQYALPHHALSRIVHGLTRSTNPRLKEALLGAFLERFDVNLDEAQHPDPNSYDSFNAFFTRALKPGSREIANASLVSPVDGQISQRGDIRGKKLFQAKGRHYRLNELLGKTVDTGPWQDGQFCTLYLAPKDYHRIHMPMDGEVTRIEHLPGRLFSVNPATTRVIPRLFGRNERVAVHFDTEYGPMAMVLVGALLVGSIETVWSGEITPPTRLKPRALPLPPNNQRRLGKGEEMGRFNMGSTVILILPPKAPRLNRLLYPGADVRLGQAIS